MEEEALSGADGEMERWRDGENCGKSKHSLASLSLYPLDFF
jgi:hypothetical protein